MTGFSEIRFLDYVLMILIIMVQLIFPIFMYRTYIGNVKDIFKKRKND